MESPAAQALTHFYRAIELDPSYAAAHGWAARAYVQRNTGWWDDPDKDRIEMERLARRAVELGRGMLLRSARRRSAAASTMRANA